MKKLIVFIALLIPLAVWSQNGKVFDSLTVTSKILNSERKFAIYLPPDYETSQRKYPVLYLLHGMGDDQTGWVQFGEVLHIADEAINSGQATPMIIVMPDANTGRVGYFNSIKGDWLYEDFFFKELIPFVEKNYRIKSDKRFRAVAGLSMGGGGTFMYALHHPEMFSSACPLSAYVGPLTIDELKNNMPNDIKGLSNNQIEEYLSRHNAISLVNSVNADLVKSVRWYIDCGDDDFLFEGNSLIHIALRKKNIAHEFRIRDGGHNWTYWRVSLPQVLAFVSDAFHQY